MLSDAIANAGAVEELIEKLSNAKASLKRLQRLNDVELPRLITADDIKRAHGVIKNAADSSDAALRQSILRCFVKEIIADSKTKTLEGNAIDPRALFAGCNPEESELISKIGSSMAVPRGVEPLSRP